MPTDAVAIAATRAYQGQLDQTAEVTGRALRDLFARFAERGATDRADLPDWYQATRPGIDATAQRAASLTDGYAALLTDTPVAASDTAVYAELADPTQPFLRTWRDLKEGLPRAVALEAGGTVAHQLGVEIVQHVARNTFGKRFPKTERWRRVITGAKTCEWCAVVSTQTYRSQASATFGHSSCDCLVLPIKESDPGLHINRQLYDELRQSGAIGRVSESRRVVRTREAIISNARRRDAVLAELAGEVDPNRRMVLAERARNWDRRSRAAAAKAAEMSTRP